MVANAVDVQALAAARPGLWAKFKDYARRHPTVIIGAGVLVLMTIVAVAAPLLAATRVALGTTPERVTHLMDQGPSWSPYTRAARMYADAVAGGASPDPAALDSSSLFSTTLARRCLTAWLAQKSVG